MIEFTNFLDIFTTLVFCISLSMLSAIMAQLVHKYWRNHKQRKLRELIVQNRFKQLVRDYKSLLLENRNLAHQNEALRRELPLYMELRTEMIHYSVRLEEENLYLNRELTTVYQNMEALESELAIDLEIRQEDVLESKGVSFEELEELPSILKGTSQLADINSAIVLAKAEGTVLFNQMKEQIKESQNNISSLIDRIDKRMDISSAETKNAEVYFYNQTGFSIRDFLPTKTA
mgnify:FL=1